MLLGVGMVSGCFCGYRLLFVVAIVQFFVLTPLLLSFSISLRPQLRHIVHMQARTLLEKGLEVDPMHAPLYHSLAELEARVFNLEGMAQLHKRAAEIFNTNALEPPPASMKLLRNKLQRDHSTTSTSYQKHTAVSALTKMVEIEFDLDETVIDTMKDDIKDALPYEGMSSLEDLDD